MAYFLVKYNKSDIIFIMKEMEIVEPVKETQQRGTVLFPMQYNYCNTSNPFYDLWIHWHTEFEIIRILSGTYNLCIAESEIQFNQGDIAILPPRIIHGDAEDKGECKYESVVFDLEMIRLHGYASDNFINRIISSEITLNYKIPSTQKDILKVVNSFFDCLQSERPGYESIPSGYLLVIFGLIEKNKLYTQKEILPAKKRVRTEKLEIILDLMRRKYSTDISLEEMADAAGFSPKYFCRIFREMTGKAPVEYLNWFRVNRACSMLRESNEKLQDISRKCGFKDFSYFIKIFHKYKGTTPLKYRRLEE